MRLSKMDPVPIRSLTYWSTRDPYLLQWKILNVRRRKRKDRGAPVQVDVPVEDVDCDVAQGENHSGTENNLAIKDISVFGTLADNLYILL